MPAGIGIGLTAELNPQQWAQVRAQLRAAAEGGLLRELNKAARTAAAEIRQTEQSAARSLPTGGSIHTGLRASIADATKVRVSDRGKGAGVRVYVSEKQVVGHLGRMTNIPGGWRHPVYGNRKAWVRQVMRPGWWDNAVAPHVGNVRDRIVEALITVLNKIGR